MTDPLVATNRPSTPQRAHDLPLDDLLPHHAASLRAVVEHLAADPTVQGVVLGGSIAHGYATPASDLDLTVVVPPDEYRRRVAENRLHWNDTDLCTYPGGYVDAKFVDTAFLEDVAAYGSDVARWAFLHNRVLLDRTEPGPDDDVLADLVARIAQFPVHEQDERVRTFAAHLLAWRWYLEESAAKQSLYLQVLAVQRLVLFACRLTLAADAMFCPSHKWLLQETARAPHRLPDLPDRLDLLLADPSQDRADALITDLLAHHGQDREDLDAQWPSLFMRDTEHAWWHRRPTAADL